MTSQRAEFGASKNSKGRTLVIYKKKKKPFVSFLDIQASFKSPARTLSSLLVTYVCSSKGHFARNVDITIFKRSAMQIHANAEAKKQKRTGVMSTNVPSRGQVNLGPSPSPPLPWR